MSNNLGRSQPLLVITATVGVLVFNYLAAVGYLGGVSPSYISDKYPTRVTPAGYAFAIWSLIYFGLIVFSIYQALPKNSARYRSLKTAYIATCAANCAWLYCWHHELILPSAAIISVLLGTLAYINSKLQTTESNSEFWCVKFPFSLYFGWVTAATILNFTIAFSAAGVQFSEPLAIRVAAALVLTAVALGIIVRFKLNNVFYPLALAWALTAIAVKQSGQTLIVACAVGVNVLLIAALSFLVKLRSSSTTVYK